MSFDPLLPQKHPRGFGLIGLLIVAALILVFTFGFQKRAAQQTSSEPDETSIGTYQPIGTNSQGQIEAGLQAKQKAVDAVKSIEQRSTQEDQ